MRNLKFFILFILGLSLTLFAGCSDEDDPIVDENNTKVQVVFKTNTGGAILSPAASAELKQAPSFLLDTFLINVDEIEFELYDDEDDVDSTIYGPTEFEGPFLIDVMSEDAVNGMVLATREVPNGQIEEVEFDFDAYKGNEVPEIVDYTVWVQGSVGGVPVIIRSDEDMEIERAFDDDQRHELTGEEMQVVIEMKFTTIINHFLNIDFNNLNATDGKIIVDSKVENGNQAFADEFMDALESSFEVNDGQD